MAGGYLSFHHALITWHYKYSRMSDAEEEGEKHPGESDLMSLLVLSFNPRCQAA
jgi:hypothetical protein